MNLFRATHRKSRTTRPTSRRKILTLEVLEDRCLLSVYTPAQIRAAYGFDQITFNNGTVKGDGTGQTIAIIDAYNAPTIQNDFKKFNSQFGISNNDGQGNYALTVTYLNSSGKVTSTPPANNVGWAEESTLDVDWAHAIAPGAHIILVEAASASYTDLLNAVDYARNLAGVSVISMSWGSGEFLGESTLDYHFTTPAGHAGVSFVASSGDTGAVTSYPAMSPNVLSVGGTSLYLSGSSYSSESTWSGSGGGISSYESKPSYQKSVTQSSTKRTGPDVSYDADPNTGVYVYLSEPGVTTGWYSFGGTSAGAPQWAALVAITNQGRTYNSDSTNRGSLTSSQLLTGIYNLPASDFHDVTKGTASSRGHSYSATTGYDLTTGRGSPIAQNVVKDLVRVTASGAIGPASTATTAPPPSGKTTGGHDLITLLGDDIFSTPGATEGVASIYVASASLASVAPAPVIVSQSVAPATTGVFTGQQQARQAAPAATTLSMPVFTDADGDRASLFQDGVVFEHLDRNVDDVLFQHRHAAPTVSLMDVTVPTSIGLTPVKIGVESEPVRAANDFFNVLREGEPANAESSPSAAPADAPAQSSFLTRTLGHAFMLVGAMSFLAEWSLPSHWTSSAETRREATPLPTK